MNYSVRLDTLRVLAAFAKAAVSEPMQPDPGQVAFLQSAEATIEAKFPIIKTICFSDRAELVPVQAPFFVGLIAAILQSANKPCCVILPDSRGVTLAVSTLVALSRLRLDVPEILRSYASISFQPGDRVLVHPSGLVYEYCGFFCPEHFKLKVVERNESRSLPVQQVARLEKTIRRMPKGYGNSDLGKPERTVLGTLVGIPGTVNRNLLRNNVAVLGSKKTFYEQTARWTIGVLDSGSLLTGTLGDTVPLGDITETGGLQFFDAYVASGEPLIAFASRPEELAAYCAAAKANTKSVIVDDVERLVRNLQAYDSVVERQSIVIVAEESQHESLGVMRERGCEMWHISPEELLLGNSSGHSGALFSTVLRKAANMRDLVVAPSPCTDVLLDEAATELSAAARAVPVENDNPAVRELFIALFGTLMSCAEFLGADGNGFASHSGARLDHAVNLLHRAQAWLTPELAEQIRLVISKLRDAASSLSEQPITSKGSVLLGSLTSAATSADPLAVVTRSEAKREELRQWMAARGYATPVYRVNEVPADQDFEQLVLVTWPSAKRFDRLMRLYAAQRLQILAYAFERHWIKDYQKNYERSVVPKLTTKRKSILLGLLADVPEGDEGEGAATTAPSDEGREPGPFDLPDERFLLRRKSTSHAGEGADSEEPCEAYYVDFAGPTFAYITEGHELPIVNSFISGSRAAAAAVYHRSIEELKVGDFVLFRESGDSDIIRFIAEDGIGAKEYALLRTKATRWRTALASIGKDPKLVWKKLKEAGLSRQLLTVRNWLTDQQMIAPKNFEDVRLIAKAAGDEELAAQLSLVQAASEQIKSLHIRAGFRLTELLRDALPKDIEVPDNREMQLDLVFGKVWIVKVEDIDEATTQCNRWLVNRLLWDKDTAGAGEAGLS